VALSLQPQYDQLNTQLQQAQQDFLRSQQYAQSAYGGYQDELAEMPRPQFGQVADDLESRLSGLQGYYSGSGVGPEGLGMEGVGMPMGEVAAGEGMGAAIGSAGFQGLSNMDARERAYRSSAAREGALSERYTHDNLLQTMQDTMQTYNNQLSNLTATQPAMIQSRMDDLRQQQLERKLANSQIRGDQAFNKYLQGYLTDLAGGNDTGWRGGNGDGNGDGNGGRDGGGGGPHRPGAGSGSHYGSGGSTTTTTGAPPSPYDDRDANGPWDTREHPIADYVSGDLAKGFYDLAPDRRGYIRKNISQYAQTHPQAWAETPVPDPTKLSPRELINLIEGLRY